MTDTVLKLDSLCKDYDRNSVLKGITGEARRGDVIGLIGLNGAGKTTLLETSLGFCKPSDGSVSVFGVESSELSSKKTKARIGFVPQSDELLENMNGASYLTLIGTFYDNWDSSFVERLCTEWDVPMDKKIQTLSVGQRQKISIISALGHQPDLIILDEPVASLDPVARRKFLRELVNITSSRDCTIIFSTHIVSDLERVASRVWLVKDGVLLIDEALDVLKEHTAKISLAAGQVIPEKYLNADLIHQAEDKANRRLIYRNWNEQKQAQLEQDIGAPFDSEMSLSLEDIFLEIHS